MVEGANPWWAKRIFAVEIFETLARFDERSVKRAVVCQNTIRTRHQVAHRYPEAFLFKGLRKTCDWDTVDVFSGVGIAAGECGKACDGGGELEIIERHGNFNYAIGGRRKARRLTIKHQRPSREAHRLVLSRSAPRVHRVAALT